MAKSMKTEGFTFSPDDQLAAEHADVMSLIEEGVASLAEPFCQHVDLKSFSSGRRLLGAKPEQSRRYLLAAVAQARYWNRLDEDARAKYNEAILAKYGAELQNGTVSMMDVVQSHPMLDGGRDRDRRETAELVINTLIRRTLPFQKEDMLAVLEWCNSAENRAHSAYVVRALRHYASKSAIDAELVGAMQKYASRLRAAWNKEIKLLAVAVEHLCYAATQPEGDDLPSVAVAPAPVPAVAGCSEVLDQLKRLTGMLPRDAAASTALIGPDQFPLRDDSPLRREHELLSSLFAQAIEAAELAQCDPRRSQIGQELLTLGPVENGRLLLAAAERHVNAAFVPIVELGASRVFPSHLVASEVVKTLAPLPFDLDRNGVFDLLLYLSAHPIQNRDGTENVRPTLISQAELIAKRSPLAEGERYVLWLLRRSLLSEIPMGMLSEEVARLSRLVNDGASFFLIPGEAWSDAINEELSRLNASQRQAWAALLRHALATDAPRPTDKWLKATRELLDAIGGITIRDTFSRWFPLVAHGKTHQIIAGNDDCLRGLLWAVQTLPRQEELVRPIASVALSAYKKIPGVGPRATKVGNAAVYALSRIATADAVEQLAMLKVRIKFAGAQREIEKAFDESAKSLALPRDQIEELGVPSYGLEEVGRHCETFDNYRAEIQVVGSRAELRWFDANGKALKSVPTRIKVDHSDDLKELQQSLKDIQAMLPAQRYRIESLFLEQNTWPIETWRERYLEHPLVGTIARRLLWKLHMGEKCQVAAFCEGHLVGSDDAPLESIDGGATIELWHPSGTMAAEILAWRTWLERHQLQQPFKQAHREVYLLTDAERNTEVYSNRFAAHILRQGQFRALARARGWTTAFLGPWDGGDLCVATRKLDRCNMRAEFWIASTAEDLVEGTGFLYIATDQVRFYAPRDADQPLPLDQVSPLVFSEVMRDVDLFVGVASVGNDPTWQDGGPQGRYRDYWHSYSFGELSQTAATRKQVLEHLVPRLKISDRCSFDERFLVVRGDKRVYKIHLGSGNILMEPNAQYLCIVPDARARSQELDLFLPFEGDNTLSIIISKALLLASDTKIKDPTILRQIDGRSPI